MDVGDLINSLNDLVNTFEDAVIRLDDVNKKLIDTGVGLEAVSNESDALKGNYDKLNKNYEELNKKISDTIGSLQNLNKKMNEEGKPEVSSSKNDRGEGKTDVLNKQKKGETNPQTIRAFTDILNRMMYGNRSVSVQSMGKAMGVTNKTALGAFAVVDGIIKVIQFGIKKATEYMTVAYENQMRAITAITTANVNTMKANLALWQDSLNGAYEAQNLAMSSNLAMVKAQNATDLANKKLTNSWFKWIPILGDVLEYQEKEMEMRQKLQEQLFQSAQDRVQQAEGYSKQNDQYLKKQDQAIRDYARSVGLSVAQTEGFENRMLSLGASLAQFNYSVEQVLKMQSRIQEESGRIINYNDEQYQKLGSLGKIMGDDTVARIQSGMVIFNQSVDDSAKIMEDMYGYANTMGISQKKLSQDVVNNLKLANKYQFKNGIKGYIEFAKWAENIRFNIAELGNVVEKIQTGGLEGVIKQSAQLQVLGGNIAMNADPLRMAYQAFQDPAGLIGNIYESIRGEGIFDKNTGDIYRDTISQIRMRGLAEAYNMSYDDLATMIREETKKRNITQELKGSNLTAEQIDAIANGAQYNQETQQWYVNDLKGQSHSLKELEQTPQLIEQILSTNKDQQMVDYAKATLSAAEQISATTLYISALIGGANFEDWNKTVTNINDILKTGMTNNMDEILKIINTVYNHNVNATREQVDGIKGISDKITEAYALLNIQEKQAKDNEETQVERGKKAVERTAAKQAVTDAEKANKGSKTIDEQSIGEYNVNMADAAYWQYKQNRASNKFSNFWYSMWKHMNISQNKRIANSNRKLKLESNRDKILEEVQNMANQYSYDNIIANNTTSTNDAVASGGGAPMAVAARNITSINDGLASADKRDTAIFAKTGGPFDKLFNGVFLKVNEIYDKVVAGIVAAPFSPVMEYAREGSRSIEEQIRRQGRGDNSPIRFETLKIEMNGRLEVSSGGQSVDIMNELQNNPLLIREVAKMISDSLSAKFYGGKAEVMPGQNTYFK